MPLVVPVMSHRQICASSEPDRRWPSRKGLHAKPYLSQHRRYMLHLGLDRLSLLTQAASIGFSTLGGLP